MDTEKNCDTCKHAEKDIMEEPCKECMKVREYIYWEEQEKEED